MAGEGMNECAALPCLALPCLALPCLALPCLAEMCTHRNVTSHAATDMKKDCAPACRSCEFLSIEGRCPMDPDAPEAWGPGDLDKTFTRLTQEPYLSEYEVQVWSSPPDGPWVITMENVVSAEEAERLIELGAEEGYDLSKNVGKVLPNGEMERLNSTTRTSMNAWQVFLAVGLHFLRALARRKSGVLSHTLFQFPTGVQKTATLTCTHEPSYIACRI
jgi:hypothetical protein